MSCQQTADELGCARTSVLKYFHVHNIPMRPTSCEIKRAGYGEIAKLLNDDEVMLRIPYSWGVTLLCIH